MFVNVYMCEIALITTESTDYEVSAAIFIELLKFQCEVLSFWDASVCLVTYQGHNQEVEEGRLSLALFWKMNKLP